jgi:hypothetical protein
VLEHHAREDEVEGLCGGQRGRIAGDVEAGRLEAVGHERKLPG